MSRATTVCSIIGASGVSCVVCTVHARVQVTFQGTLTQVIVAFRGVFDSALIADARAFSTNPYPAAMGVVSVTDLSLRLLIGTWPAVDTALQRGVGW